MTSMSTDAWDSPILGAFLREVDTTLLPKMRSSEVMACIVPEGETDVKFATEIGIALMLGKPIILLVRPGTVLPPKLEKIADYIVAIDLSKPWTIQPAVLAAMDVLAADGVL